MFDFQEAYLNGINFRRELTNKSSKEIAAMMDNIYQIVKDDYEFKQLDEYYKHKTMKLEFGAETYEKCDIHEDYILQEATVTWGDWTRAKIKLDGLSITAYIKGEHENEKAVWKITWAQFKKLNELFVTNE